MAIKQSVVSAINEQINKEFYSYYLYLAMAAHFESSNMRGFGHWLRIQAKEEAEHAMKLFDYLISRGGKVILLQIAAPTSNWKSHRDVFEDAYKHEQKVTGLITKLLELAKSEKDHPTEIFLQWFVTEQVEEEASAHEVLRKVQLAGSESSALFVLDSELGKRT